jgi:hypothetical protein
LTFRPNSSLPPTKSWSDSISGAGNYALKYAKKVGPFLILPQLSPRKKSFKNQRSG